MNVRKVVTCRMFSNFCMDVRIIILMGIHIIDRMPLSLCWKMNLVPYLGTDGLIRDQRYWTDPESGIPMPGEYRDR